MQRDGWHISSRTNTVLTSTRTDFRLRASLDAFEGDRRVFSRSWDSTIPRDHL